MHLLFISSMLDTSHIHVPFKDVGSIFEFVEESLLEIISS